MQSAVYALYAWFDQDDGGTEHVATFVTSDDVPDPKARAHEVMRRMTGDGTYETMSVEMLTTNLSNGELKLRPSLHEVAQKDFVDAAARELMDEGCLTIPLWVNPAWLVHEVKANYDLGVDFSGRRMTLVSKEEAERRVREGIAPERRARPSKDAAESDAYDRDAGFTETV
jgi:hypothetical protein